MAEIMHVSTDSVTHINALIEESLGKTLIDLNRICPTRQSITITKFYVIPAVDQWSIVQMRRVHFAIEFLDEKMPI